MDARQGALYHFLLQIAISEKNEADDSDLTEWRSLRGMARGKAGASAFCYPGLNGAFLPVPHKGDRDLVPGIERFQDIGKIPEAGDRD